MNYKTRIKGNENIKYIVFIMILGSVLLCGLSTIVASDVSINNERIENSKEVVVSTSSDNNEINLKSPENSSDINDEKNTTNFFGRKFCLYKYDTIKNEKIEMEVHNDVIVINFIAQSEESLGNKNIIVTIGDKTISGVTDEKGRLTVNYKNANEYSISATFTGDSENMGCSVKYTPNPDQSNKNSNSETKAVMKDNKTSVPMKKTGMPIIGVLLTLLSILGISIMEK